MRPIPFAAGLPDNLFEHDGQITKREIRAVTLSSLAPQPGHLLEIGILGQDSKAVALSPLPHQIIIGFEQVYIFYVAATGIIRLERLGQSERQVFVEE